MPTCARIVRTARPNNAAIGPGGLFAIKSDASAIRLFASSSSPTSQEPQSEAQVTALHQQLDTSVWPDLVCEHVGRSSSTQAENINTPPAIRFCFGKVSLGDAYANRSDPFINMLPHQLEIADRPPAHKRISVLCRRERSDTAAISGRLRPQRGHVLRACDS